MYYQLVIYDPQLFIEYFLIDPNNSNHSFEVPYHSYKGLKVDIEGDNVSEGDKYENKRYMDTKFQRHK